MWRHIASVLAATVVASHGAAGAEQRLLQVSSIVCGRLEVSSVFGYATISRYMNEQGSGTVLYLARVKEFDSEDIRALQFCRYKVVGAERQQECIGGRDLDTGSLLFGVVETLSGPPYVGELRLRSASENLAFRNVSDADPTDDDAEETFCGVGYPTIERNGLYYVSSLGVAYFEAGRDYVLAMRDGVLVAASVHDEVILDYLRDKTDENTRRLLEAARVAAEKAP